VNPEVSVDVKSWGVTLRRWSVDSSGRVEHSSGEKVGAKQDPAVIEIRRAVLTPSQLAAVHAGLAQVESVLSRPEQCDLMMTDGAYGTVRWFEDDQRVELPFSANCVKGRDHELAVAIFAVDKIVDDAAMTTEPVERRAGSNSR